MRNLTHDQVTEVEFSRSFCVLCSASHRKTKGSGALCVRFVVSLINAFSPPTASKGSAAPQPAAVINLTRPHGASHRDSAPLAPLEPAG